MKNLAFLFLGIGSLLTSPLIAQEECSASPSRGGDCWTTEDVIDDRIDHHAQSAMLRMFAGGGERAKEASQMLCAVKTHELDGIFLPDQRVPVRRAQAADSGWWLIIPTAAPSTCYKQPPEQPPLIAFKKQIKDDRDLVATALSEAWKACGITPSAPRCYNATISKPEPDDTDHEPKGECSELFQCKREWGPDKILEVCKSYGVPVTGECLDVPGQACGVCASPIPPTPFCGAPGNCFPDAEPYCADGSPCIAIPGAVRHGDQCGVCESAGHKDCLQQAWDEYKKDVVRCDEEEKDALPGCVAKMAKCAASVIGGAASAAFKDCVKSAGCIVGGPSFRRFECGGQAEAKKSKKLADCSKNP